MYDYKLIVIYLKKIEIECEAGCEDKTTHHSLLVLLDCVEACNKEDKDRVVAEAAAQFGSWKPEVKLTQEPRNAMMAEARKGNRFLAAFPAEY